MKKLLEHTVAHVVYIIHVLNSELQNNKGTNGKCIETVNRYSEMCYMRPSYYYYFYYYFFSHILRHSYVPTTLCSKKTMMICMLELRLG